MIKVTQSENKRHLVETSAGVGGIRFFALLTTLLLAFNSMSAQDCATNVESHSFQSSQADLAAVATDSQFELVMWFMGAKQHHSVDVNADSSTIGSGKKQFINCGITPNRILSRTFMKKAINYDSTIV